MDSGNEESELLWSPSSETIAAAHLTAILAEHHCATYADLTALLANDDRAYVHFYDKILTRLGFIWRKPYEQVLDIPRGMPFAQWCVGSHFNAVENMLDRWLQAGRGEQVALIWEDEAGTTRQLSYAELHTQTTRCAAALARLGVGHGTSVGLWMPMVPEAAVALLAIGYLGALAVPTFTGYGPQALATRFRDAGVTVVIAADTHARRGKFHSTLATLQETLAESPNVQSLFLWVRVQPAGKAGPEITHSPEHTDTIDDFVLQAEEATVLTFKLCMPKSVQVVGWTSALLAQTDAARRLRAFELAGSDPYLLLYTSGSTGRPKGVVHSHCSFPLKVAIDHYVCFDLNPGERMLWYTDLGWMMGPFLIFGTLLLGATAVLYEGTPDFPQPDRLWAVAARHKVTHLGLAPTAVRALALYGESWPASHDLSALRILGSSGEAWNTAPYRWFSQNVGGGRIPIINYSGGTEIGGGILGCFPTMPLGPNAFHGPIPGMRADVVDENGASLRGKVGELVIRAPWLGMTQSFWAGSSQARDDERYLATYWQQNPGMWTHGDLAQIGTNIKTSANTDIDTLESTNIIANVNRDTLKNTNTSVKKNTKSGSKPALSSEQPFWYIRGRSDDTINIAGKRVGPVEFESLLASHQGVAEAAAIAVPDAIKGDVVVCLVVLKPEATSASHELTRAALFELLDHALGHALRPKLICFVDELPKTRNHKIMRRVARARYLRLSELGDLSALGNPSSLEAIDAAW